MVDSPDHLGQHRVDQVVCRARQHAVRLERRLAGTQEALPPLPTDPIVLDVAEQAHSVERTEDMLGRALAAARIVLRIVFPEECVHLGAGHDVPGESGEDSFQVHVADIWGDLRQVLVGDLGRRLVHHLLEPVLVLALVRPERGEPFADGHQVARPQQRVPAHVLEGILLLAGVGVRHAGAPQERLERVGAHPLRTHHPIALHEAHVVDEDLPQALRRVHDVDGTTPILLDHRRSLGQAGVGLLPDGGEDLEVMVDAAKLIGDLDEAELGEVPDVGGELAGDARGRREALDVLGEVLVDAVDEDRQRRLDGPEPRHEMPVRVGGDSAGARSA